MEIYIYGEEARICCIYRSVLILLIASKLFSNVSSVRTIIGLKISDNTISKTNTHDIGSYNSSTHVRLDKLNWIYSKFLRDVYAWLSL